MKEKPKSNILDGLINQITKPTRTEANQVSQKDPKPNCYGPEGWSKEKNCDPSVNDFSENLFKTSFRNGKYVF